MNKRILAGAVFCLAALAFAAAQEADSSALFDAPAAPQSSQAGSAGGGAAAQAAPQAASGFDLRLSGSHEFDYHLPVYADSWNYDGEMKSPAFRNEVGLTAKNGQLKLVSNWHFDLLPDVAGDQGQLGTWDTLTRLRPGENYLEWDPSAFKLAFGYQIYSWGVADKVNPMDTLNPRDYSSGVNADKIPVLSADAVWYASDALSFEGVFIPYEQADIWPVDFAAQIAGSGLAALGASSSNVAYDSLGYDPSSYVAGGKLSYRSDAVDASLSYLSDIDHFYTPDIQISNAGTGFYHLSAVSLERRRVQRFGADAKTTIGKFGIWAEGAYSLTGNSGSSDYSLRKSRLDYVAGFDLNYGPGDDYYLNVQYIGTWIPGFDSSYGADYGSLSPAQLAANLASAAYATEYYERSLVDGLGLENASLVQGATFDLKWTLADGAFTPQLSGVVTVPFGYDSSSITRLASLALNPELDVMPVDSFHIKLGAELAYAWYKDSNGDVNLDTTTDEIGFYTPANNIYLTILYKWNYDTAR
ncbi:MAG: hypothetical protein M0Z80_12270 [Treponema sp.]|nr:hypothetical protein [Treponema sp.]